MKASETTLLEVLEGRRQYQIPLYQRTFSWTEKELGQLWSDLQDQADLLSAGDGDGPTHFLGSVVTAPSPTSEPSFAKWLVIDGQQRLTTLSLALAAVRDHLRSQDPQTADEIDDRFLVNKYKDGDHYLRLLPTQADRNSYAECIRRGRAPGADLLAGAYRFFRRQLVVADDPADPHDITRILEVLTTRLTLVSVKVEREDNVHRIFESLNNTGRRLSQADLMRNYLFMRLPTRADYVYETHWLSLTRSFTTDQLEQLMWLQLVLDGDERVRRQDMYAAQRKRIEQTARNEFDVENYVRELFRRSTHFERLIHPDREPNPAVRTYLARLRQWQGSATYPAIMVLLDRAERGELEPDDLVRALSYIESFLVRRAICQVPANNLSRIFQAVPSQLPAGQPIADGLRQVLSGERRFWPDDDALREAIRTKPFYWQGRADQQRMILQRLEESYGHPEPVDFSKAALTVEHVMPQTPSDAWKEILAKVAEPDESPEELHERIVHTLGNLTLTAENARLSNHPFERKKDLFESSHLEMNRAIADTQSWGPLEIEQRAAELSERAIRTWPGPLEGRHVVERTRDWALLHQILAAMPEGSWTTYGDLAAVIGSHAVPVGRHLANTSNVPNAYRVLTAEGTVSPGFRWGTSEDRGEIHEVLRQDGIDFNESGVANASQRLRSSDLAHLVGMNGEQAAVPSEEPNDAAREQRFIYRLRENNPAETVTGLWALADHWRMLGGVLGFGRGATVTSGFLWLHRPTLPDIWPMTIYPTQGREGYVEVVFQYLSSREPFDDAGLREEFRNRLNQASGIDISASKLALRPNFPLGVLADREALEVVSESLTWFRDTALSRTLL